ncbi:glycosyltransferase family 4 protein [Dellaglioa carnosa]|uniref:Glycosyltransferase family 4 protein n=1 Tax=Dellaglioa carnosa TaxID=2995136 RepID=A0ABT4JKS3_9LACO|nr:glycosyltransferase family 4 protein [Dellaglioa carnosa]MCZ2490551.1 glycosyltransferase family 4 protein [Dellaglioa carnosa]MCZ2493629.1 glycosyltransferase family 4 protein [Dellaglioa carnosa]MDK1730493.1 glycosyltransferase family 4 protein [Dellaglioa carnosa]
MLLINMFSAADSVKGQGVGSAYTEMMRLLKERFPTEFKISVNKYSRSDISHYHTINFPYYLSTFMPGRGKKIGYVHFLPETLEGSVKIPQPFKAIFYWYVIAFYKRMDHIVVVNPSFIPKLEAAKISKEHVTYIPNFVSKKVFYEKTAEEKQAFRDELNIPADKFIVFGDGQVQERKGVPDFITLAKQNPDMQFIWAGGFSFGKLTDGYAELKKVVDNPPSNLIFTGIIDREALVNYYNIANLFLLPSFNELFPMSVLEAFSCGTPVLLRDLDLYKAVIDGYYDAATDVDDMQIKLRKLKEDPNALTVLHDKADQASAYYSEDRLAEIWHQFYLDQSKED